MRATGTACTLQGLMIRELVSTWRCNYRKCRNTVKADWELYEEAYNHMIAENVIPDDLRHFEEVYEDSAFIEDPIGILAAYGQKRAGEVRGLLRGAQRQK